MPCALTIRAARPKSCPRFGHHRAARKVGASRSCFRLWGPAIGYVETGRCHLPSGAAVAGHRGFMQAPVQSCLSSGLDARCPQQQRRRRAAILQPQSHLVAHHVDPSTMPRTPARLLPISRWRMRARPMHLSASTCARRSSNRRSHLGSIEARVPALVTARGVITETPAILAFVAQSFPAPTWLRSRTLLHSPSCNSFNSYLCATVHIAHAHRMRGYRWAGLSPPVRRTCSAKCRSCGDGRLRADLNATCVEAVGHGRGPTRSPILTSLRRRNGWRPTAWTCRACRASYRASRPHGGARQRQQSHRPRKWPFRPEREHPAQATKRSCRRPHYLFEPDVGRGVHFWRSEPVLRAAGSEPLAAKPPTQPAP